MTFSSTSPAFLLENGAAYHIAHATALTEYLLTLYFKPEYKRHPYVSIIGKRRATSPCIRSRPRALTIITGVILVIVGQALRSTAMIHAASNFSHVMAFRKQEGHVLVTDGIYK